jgi:hypothetical protein
MNTKTLMLAAVAALAIGSGSAMAQSQVPGPGEGAYFSGQRQAAPKIQKGWAGPVQSGSSDVEQMRPGRIDHLVPFDGDYTTLANPG